MDAERRGRLREALDQVRADSLGRLPESVLLVHVAPAGDLTVYRGLTCTKAVYYGIRNRCLVWSTHLHDLVDRTSVVATLRSETLASLICNGNLAPGATYFRGVQRLPPGCMLRVQGGSVRVLRLDEFRVDDSEGRSLADLAGELRHLLRQSILAGCGSRDQIGVSLSGGIDSGAVLVEVAALEADTVALHYTAGGLSAILDLERMRAEAAAKALGVRLHVVDVRDTLQANGRYVQPEVPLSAPYAQGVLGLNLVLAEHCSQLGLDVLLTGYLSDQLFGTSVLDLQPDEESRSLGRRLRLLRVLWALYRLKRPVLGWQFGLCGHTKPPVVGSALDDGSVQRMLSSVTFIRAVARNEAVRVWREATEERATRASAALGSLSSESRLSCFMALADGLERPGLEVLHGDVFQPHGVELRHPFISRPLIEFALSLGGAHRIRRLNGHVLDKVALRFAYIDHLPRENVRLKVWLQMPIIFQRVLQQNAHLVRQLLGPCSLLAQLNIIEPALVAAALDDSRLRGQQSGYLLAACFIERWLTQLQHAAHEPIHA
jgi:asparagine synthetase B (glutamine-hydrolysing)